MDSVRPTPKHRIAIRMAGEGIPVMAIARVLQFTQEGIHDVLALAMERGAITRMPAPDWPVPDDAADPRRFDAAGPTIEFGEPAEIVNLITPLMAEFDLPRQEAIMLGVMLARGEVTHPEMHRAIVRSTSTDPKLVHVIKCRLNQKLDAHCIMLEPRFGSGYGLDPAARVYVLEKLERRCRVPVALRRKIRATQVLEVAA